MTKGICTGISFKLINLSLMIQIDRAQNTALKAYAFCFWLPMTWSRKISTASPETHFRISQLSDNGVFGKVNVSKIFRLIKTGKKNKVSLLSMSDNGNSGTKSIWETSTQKVIYKTQAIKETWKYEDSNRTIYTELLTHKYWQNRKWNAL